MLVVGLLILAVVLAAALIIALVSFPSALGTRPPAPTPAEALAEAGLRLADSMLTSSPQGADWRPPFTPFDARRYNAAEPATWPVPPVVFDDGACSPNLFGPDRRPGTADDYYSAEEIKHGWAPLVSRTPLGAPGPSRPYYVRYGFTRYSGSETNGSSAGHFLLRITYCPSPPFRPAAIAANSNRLTGLQPGPLSNYLKIEAIGVADGPAFDSHYTVAYKALGLADHLLWITDKERTGKPATVGFEPWVDMNVTGKLDSADPDQPADRASDDFLVTHFEGPLRTNCPLALLGDNAGSPPTGGGTKNETLGGLQWDLVTQPLGYSDPLGWHPRYGGYLRDDRVQSEHQIQEVNQDQSGAWAQSTTLNLRGLRGVADSYTVWDSRVTTAVTATPHFSTYDGRVLDNVRGGDAQGQSRQVTSLEPPELFQTDPATGVGRYYALTRDSGPLLRGSGPQPFAAHAGRYGHGPGLYADNFADLQFVNRDGGHNMSALMEDLLGHLQTGDPRAADSGWDAVRSVYAPKGLQVRLYRSEDDLVRDQGITSAAQIVTRQNPGVLQPGQIWWPGHVTGGPQGQLGRGEPGLRLERDDGHWKIADPRASDSPSLGSDANTNVMFVDYPPPGNQVLFAEGNIRIQGQLPPDPTGRGRYNLTVVSGGTIYVDGQILSPQDVQWTNREIADLKLDLGAGPGQPLAAGRPQGRFTEQKKSGLRDEQNSYIALLARDCVVLNPTQLVPQLVQGAITARSDGADPPLNYGQHWELSPGSDGSIFSRFYFGAPVPVTKLDGVATPDIINLMAYQTATDPGPAAIGLRLYNAGDDGVTPQNRSGADYVFDRQLAATDPARYLFSFVPTASGAATVPALSPNWAPLFSQDNPLVPWPLSGRSAPAPPTGFARWIATSPGARNALWLRYAAGETPYWLKRFKLEELDAVSGQPTGALHAKVNAVMYAQEGCFFIIPGPYFAESASGANAARFRRYNYDLEIHGAISENFHAPAAAWREWQDHWAYPQYFERGDELALAYGSIRYFYDDTLLASRAEPPTKLDITGGQAIRYASEDLADPGINLPKLPLLPTCPGFVQVPVSPASAPY